MRTPAVPTLCDVNVLLAQYMRALTILILFTLTFFSFYLSVTRVPYALQRAIEAAANHAGTAATARATPRMKRSETA